MVPPLQVPSPLDDKGNLLLFPVDSLDGKIESDKGWRQVQGPPHRPAVVPPPFCAIDYESYYTTAYSLYKITPWEYVTHPSFNAYLVSLERFDGLNWWRWVGHPDDAPWSDIVGLEKCSHNAPFDELVTRFLVKQGRVPAGVLTEKWHCTMDLAAYFQIDRGLDAAAPFFLGEIADKTTRAKMKDGGAGAQEIKDYAAKDARQCGWIWYFNHHAWPQVEQYLSRLQRRAGWAGVWADQPACRAAIAKMKQIQLQVAMRIPWANKYAVTGSKGLIIECAKRGIPTPPPAAPRPGVKKKSEQPGVALDDPGVLAWAKRFDTDNWLEDIRTFSKSRQLEAHCRMLLDRARKDGTVPFELIYRKAPHTARWQSGGGLRMQNLDKDEFHGFNARWFIHARPAHKFLIADLSQIEPRVLNWLVGDKVFLEACAKGASPYDAHARSTMDYKEDKPLKKYSPGLYALAKARLLALGYQAGPPKFCEMARDMAQITVFEDEKSYSPNLKDFYRASQISDRIERNDLDGWSIFPAAVESVYDFRNKSPLIAHPKTGVWATSEAAMRACVGGDHFVPLPNGEVIRYYDVRELPPEGNRRTGELTAWVVKNSKNPKHKSKLYGGKLTENRVQRVAREVLADMIARVSLIDPRRLKFRWSVHDEIIAEAPACDAKFLFEAMLHEMKTPPAWAKGLPVSAEGSEQKDDNGKVIASGILDHYIK
jgi:hypothetical protein